MTIGKDVGVSLPEKRHDDLVHQTFEAQQAVSKGKERVCLEGSASPGSQYCEQDDGYESDEWVVYCRERGVTA